MVLELKAFLAVTLYMGMKKQPNVKSYWMKPPSIFHCSTISNIFTRKRYMTLTRCLHIMDPATYVTDRALPGYDKMGQVRGMVDVVRDSFKKVWSLGKFLTIDKMMIHYKGHIVQLDNICPRSPINGA
jgi:hypothetical protein